MLCTAAAVFEPFYCTELRIYSSSCAAASGDTGKSPRSAYACFLSGTSSEEQGRLQVCVKVCPACVSPGCSKNPS